MATVAMRINTDGSILALSGSGVEELLDLRAFGKLEVERAGNIHFDSGSQTWGWRSVDGKYEGQGFATRRLAVADEIRVMMGTL